MTKDDMIAADVRKALADCLCAYCETDIDGLFRSESESCAGCLALEAAKQAYLLQRQRQHAAKERGEG